MSNGPLGPGQCVDTAVAGITGLLYSTSELYNTSQFINPQLINIANMNSTSQDAWQRSEAYRLVLNSIVPPPPDLAQALQDIDTFQEAIADFQFATGQYQIWTNYISGKSDVFPFNNASLAVLFPGGPPPGFDIGFPFLASLSFAGVLGAAAGGNKGAYVKCEVDPNDPCAKIKTVLGSVMGVFNTVLQSIIDGFNLMIDFAANILDYIQTALGYIEAVIGILANALVELVDMVRKAILDGMSRLFQGLTLDPCLSVVMQNIMTPALKQAVGLPAI